MLILWLLIGYLAGFVSMFAVARWSERRMFAEIERAMTTRRGESDGTQDQR
jgi:hypothetical protein